MNRLARWIRHFSKFGVPLLFLFFIGGAIIDAEYRWPAAAAALDDYPSERAVLVGFNYRSAGSDWERSSSYVLFPSLRKITVSATSHTARKSVESSFGMTGLLLVLAYIVVGIALSAWYWTRGVGRSQP
jgi:hypothetical protein